jgi:hypothetical protein
MRRTREVEKLLMRLAEIDADLSRLKKERECLEYALVVVGYQKSNATDKPVSAATNS